METEKKLPTDLIIEPSHICKMYPGITKEQASKRLYYWKKKKLKKPRGGALLGSELAGIMGISIDQLRRLI